MSFEKMDGEAGLLDVGGMPSSGSCKYHLKRYVKRIGKEMGNLAKLVV
jgi:hypothetical protein